MNYADSSKLKSSTSTIGYQYSRREIEEEILHHAAKVVDSGWFSRAKHIENLKFWFSELSSLNQNHS